MVGVHGGSRVPVHRGGQLGPLLDALDYFLKKKKTEKGQGNVDRRSPQLAVGKKVVVAVLAVSYGDKLPRGETLTQNA